MTARTTQTYTIAYAGDAFLAVVPDGDDIDTAVKTVEEHAGETFPDYRIEEGCILTDEPAEDDHVLFASPHGCCGWITVREESEGHESDVSYGYAVRS